MYVKNLLLKNFRNFKEEKIEFCPGVNVIYGDNAQGKTNLLEAVWLFCGGHSFRGAKDGELIGFGCDSAQIETEFISGDYEWNAVIKYSQGKKEITVNQICKSGAELAKRFFAVVFSPEHMTLVKNGPAQRRKFLDGALAREKLSYAVSLAKFNKTLQQRNALLKDIYRHPELEEILSVWDTSLSFQAARVAVERVKYIERLSAAANRLHEGISGGSENLKVEYFSTVSYNSLDEDDYAEKYFDMLSKSRAEDIKAGSTQTGPHRDDLEISLNGTAARNFASQGQQRSIVVSLKLAEAQLLSEIVGEKPVIILDDVLSELDFSRQDFLLNKIRDNQVFLSCCEPSNREQLRDGTVFNIASGRIKNVSSFGSGHGGAG